MTAPALSLTATQRAELKRMATSSSLPHRQVLQAKALLWAGDGVANQEIARRCQVTPDAVRRWRTRFAEQGVDGVGKIAKGRGRKSPLTEGTVAEIVRVTCKEKPTDGGTHWTTRLLAKRFGLGKDSIAKVWADHNLKPWKVSTFKVSNDPNFEAKLVDVVGLYMNPPKRAVVFSFDEKTQCQAMDRTQPSLPMVPGRAGTMTHDYKRNGTTDLFAAMNVATGEVLTHCQKGHTAKDVLRFFRQIDATVPRGLAVHVVLDNLSAHKAPEIQKWLAHKDRPTLAPALHPDLKFLDQPHRALVQRTHRPHAQARSLHQRPGTSEGDPGLVGAVEQRPQALRLESHRRGHHRKGPARPRSTDPPDQFNDGPLADVEQCCFQGSAFRVEPRLCPRHAVLDAFVPPSPKHVVHVGRSTHCDVCVTRSTYCDWQHLCSLLLGHPVRIREDAHAVRSVGTREGRRAVERVQEGHPPVQGVHAVRDARGWPRKVKVDERLRPSLPEHHVARAVVLV
jgi:transposase